MTRLAAYLARIGLPARPAADAAGLEAVLVAHRQAIAFENLDIALGRGIAIDGEAVFDKLVTRRRGGYCFEHNRLFADSLAGMGFAARPLLARVVLGLGDSAADTLPPRTHVFSLVDIDGVPWLADAGFGGSFVPPMRLAEAAPVRTPDGALHRLRCGDGPGSLAGEWRLERAGPAAATDGRAASHGDWQAQYVFDLAEVAASDLEQANHWTSTRPGLRFTTLQVVSRVLPDGFASLTDRTLTVFRGDTEMRREFADAAVWRACLREVFDLDLTDANVAALRLFAA